MQPTGDLLQDDITLVVPECVIHLLEPVEVEHQNPDPVTAGPAGRRQRLVQGLLQRLAVGQTGEVVQACGHA